MLAYLFWHRPRESDAGDAYEHALVAFHRSLARSLPVGMLASATYRVAELPWLARAHGGGDGAGSGAPGGGDAQGGYEDWYLLEDFAALGVLNEAAVGRGHQTSHDAVAHRFDAGAGGLYRLLEGEPCAEALGEATTAVWVTRPLGSERPGLAELMGDGMDPAAASLWRRQLVLGPAPELCVLAAEVPSGVNPARLPAGWSATILDRDVLWSG